MTRDEILKMEAGREMNLLITMNIMGWSKKVPRPKRWQCRDGDYALMDEFSHLLCPNCQIHDYSGSIEAAWEVVEKMEDCLHLKQHGKKGIWEANFCSSIEVASGETTPLAICRAALLATIDHSLLGEEKEKKDEG